MAMKDLYARIPVNKTTARVIAKGFEYVAKKKITTADQPTPFLTRPFPYKNAKNLAETNGEDLTGEKIGWLTVIGLSKEHSGKWVARCVCGTYTLRSGKAIKNQENDCDRCELCRHKAYLKRVENFRRTGKNISIREY
jgi:hypothetical protein